MAKQRPSTRAPAVASLFNTVSHGERFLMDYVGPIASDPKVAIAELIANASDAGARRVVVTWPKAAGELFAVTDDGTGMTRDEFLLRWSCLGYDRTKTQGDKVVFPPGVRYTGTRRPFGQNGKGRFAPFCFADEYQIRTTIGGVTTAAIIGLPAGDGPPFQLTNVTEDTTGEPHGTTISWTADKRRLEEKTVAELITSVFMLDPQFVIELNGTILDLSSLDGVQQDVVQVPPHGTVNVYTIDTGETWRPKRHNRPGVTWRVNSRLVGEPGWTEFDAEERFPNGRPDETRRFCFLVEADVLKPLVKPDWTGFYDGAPTAAVKNAVFSHVVKAIHLLTTDNRKKRKSNAIVANRQSIRSLPRLSVETVTRFIDEVQTSCPRLSQKELNTTVQILANLEQARSGYDLLSQLASLDPIDLDTWNAIIKTWDAHDAGVVLDLIDRRLASVKRLDKLIQSRATDEVHDLLPMFGKGLWMFGPEFETAEFQANRSIATVISGLLGSTPTPTAAIRPDVVAIPTGYILPFTLNGFDANNEVGPIAKLLIVELKKGGFEIGQDEINQAKKYIRALRKGGHIDKTTVVTAYVLGWSVGEDASDETIGNDGEPKDKIFPRPYAQVVRRAEARTFHLREKLKGKGDQPALDPDVIDAINATSEPLFT
jgi:hypothetical protein